MPQILIQPSIGEPIDIAAAKLHLRLTEASQDAIVYGLISAARIAAESATRRQFLHARWKLVIDALPYWGMGTVLPFGESVNMPDFGVLIPHAPLVVVESIKYLDMNGAQQTVDPSIYTVRDGGDDFPAIITPQFGQIWPIVRPQVGAVEITYVAGHASLFARIGSTIKVIGPATWSVGDVVQFYNSGGALPSGLSANMPYQIASVPSAGIYTLNDISGNPITLADAGSGSNFIGVVPAGILSWMLIRIGSLFQNREEVAILSRGALHELPFIDGLLDSYKVMFP